MAKIKFDMSGIPEQPHFILAYKDGRIIGELSNISGIKIKACMKDTTEASFTVHKKRQWKHNAILGGNCGLPSYFMHRMEYMV